MYERTWPVVNNTAQMLGRDGQTPVCEDVGEDALAGDGPHAGSGAGAARHVLRNADAPVHLTVGAGGQKEGHQGFERETPVWLATKIGDAWGFGTLTVWANGTGLVWRQYRNGDSASAASDVLVDEMVLVKDGPGRLDNERQDDPQFSVDRRCGAGYSECTGVQ